VSKITVILLPFCLSSYFSSRVRERNLLRFYVGCLQCKTVKGSGMLLSVCDWFTAYGTLHGNVRIISARRTLQTKH